MRTILIIIFLFIGINQSKTFTCKVIGVTDGDSIVVLTSDNEQLKIRLESIDCPELHQDYGQKAKQATVDLCFHKQVRVEKTGTDRYGRTLGFVYVNDVCVNDELLKLGMAWHYKQYSKDVRLAQLEVEARNKKVGLWSLPNPVPPWDFRHRK